MTKRYATAMDPIPYAGGSVHSNDPSFATSILEHNAFHRTQAHSDHSSKTVTSADGRTFNKEDLLYITQENTVSCTSTSGGGVGPLRRREPRRELRRRGLGVAR